MRLLLALSTLLLLPGGGMLRAQDDTPPTPASPSLLLGLGIDRYVGATFGAVPVFDGAPGCGLFDGGLGTSWEVGGEIVASRLAGPLDLGARIVFADERVSADARPLDPQRVFDRARGETITIDRRYLHVAAFRTIRLELLPSLRLAPSLRLFGGPTLGFRFDGAFTQSERVDGPEGFLFDDGSVERPLPGGTPSTLRRLALGAVLGVGWRVRLGERLSAEPRAAIRIDMLDAAAELRRTTIGASLGVTLLYGRSDDEETRAEIAQATEERDGIGTTPTDHGTDSSPSIDTVTERADAVPPTPDDTERSDSTPSARASAHLSATLSVVAMEGDIERDDTAFVQPRLVRERSVLWITDGIAVDDAVDMIRAIDPTLGADAIRTAVEAAGGGGRPAIIDREMREFDAPRILLRPSVGGGTPAFWEIVFRQRGTTVARFADDDPGVDGTPAWDLHVPAIDSAAPPLIAELLAVDAAGGRARAYDTLQVAFLPESGAATGRRTLFALPLPDGDDDYPGRYLGSFTSSLTPGAVVEVVLPATEPSAPALGVIRAYFAGRGVEIIVKRIEGMREGGMIGIVIEE